MWMTDLKPPKKLKCHINSLSSGQENEQFHNDWLKMKHTATQMNPEDDEKKLFLYVRMKLERATHASKRDWRALHKLNVHSFLSTFLWRTARNRRGLTNRPTVLFIPQTKACFGGGTWSCTSGGGDREGVGLSYAYERMPQHHLSLRAHAEKQRLPNGLRWRLEMGV